jgi:hypothetical protein
MVAVHYLLVSAMWLAGWGFQLVLRNGARACAVCRPKRKGWRITASSNILGALGRNFWSSGAQDFCLWRRDFHLPLGWLGQEKVCVCPEGWGQEVTCAHPEGQA